MTIRPKCLWGRAILVGGGALTGLLMGWTGAGTLLAQTNTVNPPYVQSSPQIPRNFLNKNTIQLPIQIDAASRATIAEIELYIKDRPAAEWKLRDKVGATQTAFMIQVPQDGEYWFTMVMVDKQGRRFPSDVSKEAPRLCVVIDTKAPLVEFINLGTVPEGQLIQCDVSDANLDSAQTGFFFQGGDGNFRPLEPLPGRGNVFCVPSQAVFTGVVRVTAQDFAKNQTQREMSVKDMKDLTVRGTAPTTNPQPQPVVAPPPAPVSPDGKMPTKLPLVVINATPDLPPNSPPHPQRMPSGPSRPDGSDGPRIPEHKASSSPIAQTPTATNVVAPPPMPTTNPVESVSLKRQIVNNAKVFLDYQIENVGASGVGKVEVWFTRDQAKTWQRLSEDTQRKGPAEVQFPGDGLFGVTLVASNGRGAGAAPPVAGDTPDWWIEVDTTKPSAQITKVHSVTEEGQAVVNIHWAAQDKNLGETPVDLLYASSPQGPWQPIAKGLKGEGQHRWTPPREIGSQAHIQLIVRDQAGNTSAVQTLVPVLFDDPARPRAVIRGISTGTATLP